MVIKNFCVFGDSFVYRNDDNPRTWIAQTASAFGSEPRIVATPGCGQDWIFGQLYQYRHVITPNDRVVVVLTEPGRRWLFKDKPHHSNIYVSNYKDVLSAQECKVLESYVNYIQDDNLDNLAMINRLGWLDSLAARCYWQRPLIIKGFDLDINENEYPYLSFAKGVLSDVSKAEVAGDYQTIIKGFDVRYNHLCLDNHTVLSRKIRDFCTSGYPPDLTTDFKTNILKQDFYKDQQFIQDQLYPEAVFRWNNVL
jgi:hypothetical protein